MRPWSELERILVFRTGHLGDTIVALPALHSLREACPGSHITLLCNAGEAGGDRVTAPGVLPRGGLIDEWLTYGSGRNPVAGAIARAGLLRQLRSRRFDALVYLMTRNRSAGAIARDRLFFRAAGIRRMVGVGYLSSRLLPRRPSAPIDPDSVAHPGGPLPRVERESDFLLDLLAAEGIPPSSRGADLLLSAHELQQADAWLAAHCGDDFRSRTLLALAPGSGWKSKIWKEEHFLEVTRRLVERHSVVPVVYGGVDERPVGERIVAALGSGANSAGELGARVGAAAMRHARLYLGNDTGSMHLAAAVGVPCVAIFAAIDYPGRWEPGGAGHRILRVAVPCEGCFTPDCFNRHQCLEAIPPDRVLAACEEVLGR
ncbi:MAG: glycosyltransferase family 9 protein [Thermoanaerobaculia bacterium]